LRPRVLTSDFTWLIVEVDFEMTRFRSADGHPRRVTGPVCCAERVDGTRPCYARSAVERAGPMAGGDLDHNWPQGSIRSRRSKARQGSASWDMPVVWWLSGWQMSKSVAWRRGIGRAAVVSLDFNLKSRLFPGRPGHLTSQAAGRRAADAQGRWRRWAGRPGWRGTARRG